VYVPVLSQLCGMQAAVSGTSAAGSTGLLAATATNTHKELLGNMQKFLSQARVAGSCGKHSDSNEQFTHVACLVHASMNVLVV
jgi:hypothetical protein